MVTVPCQWYLMFSTWKSTIKVYKSQSILSNHLCVSLGLYIANVYNHFCKENKAEGLVNSLSVCSLKFFPDICRGNKIRTELRESIAYYGQQGRSRNMDASLSFISNNLGANKMTRIKNREGKMTRMKNRDRMVKKEAQAKKVHFLLS